MKKNGLFLLVLTATLVVMPGTLWGQGMNHAAGEMASEDLLPPNAKPGECYARVFVPPVYETETEQRLKKEEGERIELVAARYETLTEQVLVREASSKLEIVPATYKWVEERMLVKPEGEKLVQVPAEFKTVTEEVLDKPAHTIWKKGRGPVEKVNNGTGEIMCLVEVPATYKTVSKRVIASPARVETVVVPAEYKTVRKQVVATPPTTRTVEIPAQYETVKVTKLVSGPSENRIAIPAEYQTISRQVLVRDGYMDRQQVLCETNMSRSRIVAMQRALSAKGFNPGPIDGVIGSETYEAVRAFQRENGMATGGVTLAMLQKLGV